MNDERRVQGADAGALPAVRRGGPDLRTVGSGGVRAADAVAAGQPETQGGAGDRSPLCVVVPIRTVSGLNVREHWRARSRRVKAERTATAWTLKGKKPPTLPCTVLLTRTGPSNGLDDDNLRGASKGVRDEIAKWLGVDDRSPLVTWAYEQRRAKAWAVEVEIR